MIVGKPRIVDGWSRTVLDLTLRKSLPPGPIEPDQPPWSERRLEHSLLRSPEVLARALSLKPAGLIALGQVAEIDFYLRSGDEIHLLELKGPKGDRASVKWKGAVDEIARQWCAASAWLRRRDERVHLWAVCPVRWKNRVAEVPKDFRARLAKVECETLRGPNRAEIGLILYGFLQSPEGQLLAMWPATEEAPDLISDR